VGQHPAGSEGRLISAVTSRLRFRSQAAAPRRHTRHLLALPTGIVTLTCFVVPLGLILVYSFGSENLVDFNVDSGMGERSVAGAPGLPAGADVVVVVRPEELELAPAQGGEDAIVAEVIDVAFQGAQRTVRLRSAALGDLVEVTSGGAPAPERGAQVALGFRDEHSWAVPVES
jgi:hypothetical protein